MTKKKVKKKKTTETSTIKRWVISFVLVVFAAGIYTAYNYYQRIYGSNISLGKKESVHFLLKILISNASDLISFVRNLIEILIFSF